MSFCNARDLAGPCRCDLPKGHKGKHEAMVGMGQDAGRITWENRLDKSARSPLKRGKPPRAMSAPQALLNARWAGIKQAFIFLGLGCTYANEGNCSGPLDLDHIIPRSKQGPYTAANAELLCRKHHREKHGDVEWSRSAS